MIFKPSQAKCPFCRTAVQLLPRVMPLIVSTQAICRGCYRLLGWLGGAWEHVTEGPSLDAYVLAGVLFLEQ